MKVHLGIGVFWIQALVLVGLMARVALAGGKFSGRAFLTYQSVTGPRQNAEYFSQNIEALVRDRVFDKNDLTVVFYLDNHQNLSKNLTTRRYYGRLELTGRYYNLNIHYTPRQRISPLETSTSREETERQYVLQLSPPKLPRLRLYYSKKRQYLEGVFQGFNRDVRADLSYKYRFISLELNRWREKSTNASENTTTVTGGRVRVSRSLFRAVSFNSSYEYRLTETTKSPGLPRKVSNHTLTLLASGRYRKYMTSSLSFTTRRLSARNESSSNARNDNFSYQISLMPEWPVRLDIARTYILSDQDTLRSLSGYLTLQLVLTWRGKGSTQARAQLAKRLVMASTRGAIPSNLVFLTFRTKIYRGLEMRSDLNISQRPGALRPKQRYQITSILEVFAKPRRRMKVTASLQHQKYSDRFSLLHNDRASYGLSLNYFLNRRFNFGIDGRRYLVTTGNEESNGSLTFTAGTLIARRLSINVSYAVNAFKKEQGVGQEHRWEEFYRRNFNLESQWNLGIGKTLSLSYARLEQERNVPSKYMTVSYNQSF